MSARALNPDSIPEELKSFRQFVRWKYVKEPGKPKPSKIPVCPDRDANASSTDPSTWGSFDTTLANVGQHGTCGMGFVLTNADPYVGVDFDHVVQNGALLPAAAFIVEDLHSYSEISPSSEGVRVIVRGIIPAEGRKAGLGDGATVEFWDHARYVTLTGNLLPGSTEDISDGSEALCRIIDRYGAPRPRYEGGGENGDRPPCAVPVAQRIERAARYMAKVPGAIDGQFGGTTTFKVAQRLVRGFQLEEPDALRVLESWNQTCSPPWEPPDLARKVHEATSKGRMPWGCMYPAATHPPLQPVTFQWLPAPEPAPRPVLADAAFHGLAGRIVRAIGPHTEADPFGVLACFLASFGVVVGRGPHCRIGADRHGTNLFVTLVGNTSAGRKGTAYSEARRPFLLAGAGCVPPSASGLSSGEGFVWAIRDEVRTVRPVREKGRVIDHEEVVEDPGISDKRLLAIESELASVLARMAREGNTLSPLMRQAWDGHTLCTLTKKPVKATDPHVGLIAQTTQAELDHLMTETETLNGWGNRMMFTSVQRPHLLPFGGSLRDEDLLPLAMELKTTIDLVSGFGEMERDDEAKAAWGRAYPLLTADRPGLFGAITARAPQQVVRLSLVYALLDRARMIGAVHLKAALAFWSAAQQSAQTLFGGALGDTIADTLLDELRERPDGLTRTEMMLLFGKNVPAGRIKHALNLLASLGLAAGRKETSGSKGGRPSERWFESTHPNERNEVNEQTHPTEEVSSSNSFHSSGGEKNTRAEGVS